MKINLHLPDYADAMEKYLEGDKQVALEAFRKLAEKYPDNPAIFLLLGNINYGLGLLGDAMKDYEKAIELEPKFGHAYYKLGVCAFRAGYLQKAMDSFDRNLELTGQRHTMSNYWAGLIHFFLSDDTAALRSWTRLHDESPESAFTNFFMAQLKIKRQEFKEALDLLNDLLEKAPEFAELHYLEGHAYRGMFRNFDAIRCFRKVLELNPGDKRVQMELETLTDVPSI
jgi:tetratricopeptide (TPR) repeat protein